MLGTSGILLTYLVAVGMVGTLVNKVPVRSLTTTYLTYLGTQQERTHWTKRPYHGLAIANYLPHRTSSARVQAPISTYSFWIEAKVLECGFHLSRTRGEEVLLMNLLKISQKSQAKIILEARFVRCSNDLLQATKLGAYLLAYADPCGVNPWQQGELLF